MTRRLKIVPAYDYGLTSFPEFLFLGSGHQTKREAKRSLMGDDLSVEKLVPARCLSDVLMGS